MVPELCGGTTVTHVVRHDSNVRSGAASNRSIRPIGLIDKLRAMLLSSRQAAVEFARVGLARDQARQALATGLAGPGILLETAPSEAGPWILWTSKAGTP